MQAEKESQITALEQRLAGILVRSIGLYLNSADVDIGL